MGDIEGSSYEQKRRLRVLNDKIHTSNQGPIEPGHCDTIIKRLAEGDALAFNGRRFALSNDELEDSPISISVLLEHMQTVRAKDYIPSTVLQKLKEIGEKAVDSDQKVSKIANQLFPKKDQNLNGLLANLDVRIAMTQMFENVEYNKRGEQLPPEDG